jgi:hypothetical protein
VGPPRQVLTPEVLEETYGAPMHVLEHGGMPIVLDPLGSRASRAQRLQAVYPRTAER